MERCTLPQEGERGYEGFGHEADFIFVGGTAVGATLGYGGTTIYYGLSVTTPMLAGSQRLANAASISSVLTAGKTLQFNTFTLSTLPSYKKNLTMAYRFTYAGSTVITNVLQYLLLPKITPHMIFSL